MKVTDNILEKLQKKYPNSPIVSQKNTPSRTKLRMRGIEMRKTPTVGLDDGGYKYPPRKNIEKPHTICTSFKRKINTQTTWLNILEIQEIP
jgi:hypothetical protein